MKKIICILIIGVPVAIGYWLLAAPQQSIQEHDLQSSLTIFLGSKDQKTLLSNLTDFRWDEVCVYSPYSIPYPKKFKLDGYRITSKTPLINDDTVWALLFKNYATKEAFFVKNPADFSRLKENSMSKCFSHQASMLKSIETDPISKEIYTRIYLK